MTDLPRPTGLPRIVTVAPGSEVTPGGAIFGGWLLAQLDHAVGLAGRKLSGGAAVMLKITELSCHAPLYPGEEFAVHAELSRMGSSSFNLAVSAWADGADEGRAILSADVLMVAVDAAGKPRKIAA